MVSRTRPWTSVPPLGGRRGGAILGSSTYIGKQARHSRKRMMSGRVFPCGDFSFGVVPLEKKTHKESEYDRCEESAKCTTSEYIGYRGENKYTTRDIPVHQMGANLISTLLPNCAKRDRIGGKIPRRHGLKGISSYGRKMVKSGCKILEDRHGKQKLGFLTVTLPDVRGGLSRSDLREVHLKWAEITRDFLRSLSRALKVQGGDGQLVCSTEIQEKRYKATGIPALHMHICFQAWDGFSLSEEGRYAWFLSAAKIRWYWEGAICHALRRERNTIDFNASVNVKKVRKSAVGYLGKYLSKGAKVTRKVVEDGKKHWLPSKWWSLYGGLRDVVKQAIVVLDTQDCLEIRANFEQWQEGKILHKWYPVEVEINGESVIIGYSGSFTPWGYVLFLLNIGDREGDAYRKGGGAFA